MKKIFGFLLAILLCFLFMTNVRASTVLDINTTDCSDQGGTGNGSNMTNACNNTVNVENGTLQTGWGGTGHPVIHIIADVSDTLYLTVNTPGVFLPNYTYTAVEWTTTLTNWNGWIGGAMFDCNGFWGCPTVTSAGVGSGWQGTTTATGHTDYYIVVVSQCQGVSSGCNAHLTVSCSNCSVAGLTTPTPPQLTVVHQITNDNGGIAIVDNFTLKVGSTTVVSGETNSFDASTYTVSETGPAGYTSTFGGDCDSSGQIILQTGDQPKTCTLTNDDIAPSLTLVKHVTNDNGGTASPTDWTLTANGPTSISGAGGVSSNADFSAGIYTLSESAGPGGYTSGLWSCTGATLSGNTITLTLGQSATCEITNNDIAPPPVTKVFLIPGMGASWNVDALINCKNSSYSNGWTLAPYAKDVYQEVLTQLDLHGWSVIPFYYDWRTDIRNNTPLLNSLINANTATGEKVDLVGHSMGGLIGRNYLETQSGGKASKFLAVGTSNQGSALAYPAVVNGEIWANDMTEKIAATLLFKHCGIPSSFQNLLPTYNYLRDNNTKQLKDVNAMKTKNNYLPTNFAAPFWGVKVGSLAGTGKATLKIIDVIRDSKWPDGRPVGRENVSEGDDTVLVSSAQVPGAFSNVVISQSHSGIVASTEGVSKILEFLGSPGIADPPYLENTSALVLVGYPGNFWVKDKNGVTTQSENGMIAIMNPKDGDYQLQIVPTSANTSFIASQFLPDGQTLYKEYRFKGFQPISKIVKFSVKNSIEDIIKEHQEEKPESHEDVDKFITWFKNLFQNDYK